MTLLTEEQAKEKWCPFVRILALRENGDAGGAAPAYNRLGIAGTDETCFYPCGTTCVASQCMAWRWDPKQRVGDYEPEHDGKPEHRRGHCGLAGKP